MSLVGDDSVRDPRRIFEIAMRKTLDRLVAAHKQVVFVWDVPELGFEPKTCVASDRPFHLGDAAPRAPCALQRTEFDARNREYKELVAHVLTDYVDVKTFDAAAPLCDDQWCWAMKDGKILFRDYDHLSDDGSRLVAQSLASLIRQLLN